MVDQPSRHNPRHHFRRVMLPAPAIEAERERNRVGEVGRVGQREAVGSVGHCATIAEPLERNKNNRRRRISVEGGRRCVDGGYAAPQLRANRIGSEQREMIFGYCYSQIFASLSALSALIAAGLWLWASLVKTPKELNQFLIISDDGITGDVADLERGVATQSLWNSRAAIAAGIAAFLQAVASALPSCADLIKLG